MMELKRELRAKETLDYHYEEARGVQMQLNNKINGNIENINDRTTQVLIEQAKDITRFFKSKIKEIRKQFVNEK